MSDISTVVSNVIPFDFRGHSVRAITIDDEPWFVASDVCRVLDVANTTQAMQALDDDERSMFNIGRQGDANIINESGLYTLILRSRNAVAKGSKAHAFRRWVTSEVLPAIRKHGHYVDYSNAMGDLVGAVIGTSGEHVLDRVIDQKASPVPHALQRSFKHTMKSRLRSRFNVQRTALIPAEDLNDACNFIAAYALEGEWIGKEPKNQLNLSYPIGTLVARRAGMLTIRNKEQAWLDVTLHDLRDIRGDETPCEKLLSELQKAGYDIEGCWWELRTYRNKIRELASFTIGMNRVIEEPHRYAVTPNGKSA